MMNIIIKVFKSYMIYFIVMFTVFFNLSYFYFLPYIDKDMGIGINEKNLYILLKKEKINIKDENVKNLIDEEISNYDYYIQKEKEAIDLEFEHKRTILKNGLVYEKETGICTKIKSFLKNCNDLEKYDLVKEYTKLQQNQLPHCN
ncbi:hypothetical protein PT502_05780 [Aliarcobacter butzleri]|uniref:hypothetical protein n=1 Tax=Aliarcobacter butzleri TaxID=28197 RepID=UPI0024DDFFD0|nr:hypothetical protein [Aliarcobacter butzleri]MDK2083310.1 hypothetical protein [Aliarcobacter butzleri]